MDIATSVWLRSSCTIPGGPHATHKPGEGNKNCTAVNNCRVNATACASLQTPKRWSGHDWRVDRPPTGSSFTATGMVLGRDIPGGVEVSMHRKATHLTTEPPTGAPTCAGCMPAAAARLRGMSGINPNYRQAALLGLVLFKEARSGRTERLALVVLWRLADVHRRLPGQHTMPHVRRVGPLHPVSVMT